MVPGFTQKCLDRLESGYGESFPRIRKLLHADEGLAATEKQMRAISAGGQP